jgi:hypothetical protein
MAALFCNTRDMELSEALGSVGELKNVIANELVSSGFTDVVNTQGEVAGNKNGMRLSVLHLFIGGRRFYQQVMAAGDNSGVTLQTVNDVVGKIRSLHFL